MITIKKNHINNCVFTLTERSSFSDDDYILKLYSNSDGNYKEITLKRVNDLSINKQRYNEFEIEENDVEDLSNNIISLDVGTYDYTVYLSGVLIEDGKCVVKTPEYSYYVMPYYISEHYFEIERIEENTYKNSKKEYTYGK